MIYFDHAATSYPKPESVLIAMRDAVVREGGNPGRSGHRLSLLASERIYETREALCSFFDAEEPENFIFTQNATHALNLAIKTRIRHGDHVLISDLEHNAVFRPIYRLFRDGVINYSVFKTSNRVLKEIEALCTKDTRMLICTHVSNVNGQRLPVKEIGDFCRQRGIYYIIDASQGAGHIPFSIRESGADAVCAPAHKGLLGIQGAGFAYLRKKDYLMEFMEGGSGSHSLNPEMPEELPDRYEAGTLATPAIAALGAGLRYILAHGGTSAVEMHERALCRRAKEMLFSLPNVTVYAAKPEGGLLSFNLPHRSSEEVAFLLDKDGICVRGGFHCAPLAHRTLETGEYGSVRISFGPENTEDELESFYRSIKNIYFARS